MPPLPKLQSNTPLSSAPVPYRSQIDYGASKIGAGMASMGDDMTKIAHKMIELEAEEKATTAKFQAANQLSLLRTEMSTKAWDTKKTAEEYSLRSKEIYNTLAADLPPIARRSFIKNFSTLDLQARTAVTATAIKQGHGRAIAKAEIILGGLEDLVRRDSAGQVTGQVTTANALIEGHKLIDGLVSRTAIAADVGAKRKLKLNTNVAKATMDSWITLQAGSVQTMMRAREQIRSGKFEKDSPQAIAWGMLGPTEQKAIRNTLSTEMSRLATAAKAAEKKTLKETRQNGNEMLTKIFSMFDPKHMIMVDGEEVAPTESQRTEMQLKILDDVKKLSDMNPDAKILTNSYFITLSNQIRNGGNFNITDQQVYDEFERKVRLGTTTEKNIRGSSKLSKDDQDELIRQIPNYKSAAFNRAAAYIEKHPDFFAKNSWQRGFLTKEQLIVNRRLSDAAHKARKEGKPFDAEQVARDLVTKHFDEKVGGGDAAKVKASARLADLGITNSVELAAYLGNPDNKLTPAKRSQLTIDGTTAFGEKVKK